MGRKVGRRLKFKSAYLKGNVPEMKYVDTALTAVQPGVISAGSYPTNKGFQLLNGIAQGTGPTNRVGRKIAMQTLQLGFTFNAITTNNLSSATEQPVAIRLAVVYDRNPGAAGFPNISDIWQSRSGDIDSTILGYQPWDLPNKENTSRFIILRDCKIYFPTNAYTTAGTINTFMLNNTFIEGSECKLWLKLGGLEMTSKDNSVAVTSITVGSLLLVCMASVAPTGVPATEVQPYQILPRYCRVTYSDI